MIKIKAQENNAYQKKKKIFFTKIKHEKYEICFRSFLTILLLPMETKQDFILIHKSNKQQTKQCTKKTEQKINFICAKKKISTI